MVQEYRVKVLMVGFDKDRANELKQILKIYHNSQGADFFKDLLRRVHAGEQVPIYETNNDTDAMRVAQALHRAGAQLAIDGLKEQEEPF